MNDQNSTSRDSAKSKNEEGIKAFENTQATQQTQSDNKSNRLTMSEELKKEPSRIRYDSLRKALSS